jgi:hypothetical protein
VFRLLLSGGIVADKIGDISAEQGVRRVNNLSLVLWPKGVARKTHSNILTPEKGQRLLQMTYEDSQDDFLAQKLFLSP